METVSTCWWGPIFLPGCPKSLSSLGGNGLFQGPPRHQNLAVAGVRFYSQLRSRAVLEMLLGILRSALLTSYGMRNVSILCWKDFGSLKGTWNFQLNRQKYQCLQSSFTDQIENCGICRKLIRDVLKICISDFLDKTIEDRRYYQQISIVNYLFVKVVTIMSMSFDWICSPILISFIY